MRIIIIGGGEVGKTLAEHLLSDHRVTVVERNPQTVDALNDSLDVLAIAGDGTDLEVLRSAGLDDADLVIGATNVDSINLAACTLAGEASSATTVCRVRRRHHLTSWEQVRQRSAIDAMVCTDFRTAETIVQTVALPAAHDVDHFEDGRVKVAEFDVPTDSSFVGQTIAAADCYDDLTFAALFENGEVVIPTGETRIDADHRIVVIGTPSAVNTFAYDLVGRTDAPRPKCVIIGGTEIGFQTARLLEEQDHPATVIEEDPARARMIAEALPGTLVLEHDPTDTAFLEREHVGDADVVICALRSEERNLLVALLARRQGANRTVGIVKTPTFVDLFEEVGLDVALNPRYVTTEGIIRHTRGPRTTSVAVIESDRAEVIDIQVNGDSALVGRPLAEAVPALDARIVVGAVIRNDQIITPRGSTVIEPGDHVILFIATDDIGALDVV